MFRGRGGRAQKDRAPQRLGQQKKGVKEELKRMGNQRWGGAALRTGAQGRAQMESGKRAKDQDSGLTPNPAGRKQSSLWCWGCV